ncbi:DnaC-like DNA replication protein [Rhodococcus phage E3]|uniref:DnaC-like helicase loader n=1 Tax=Rhodococcus phage E3 TaxID=1007869 RepID=UPI0002C6A037|nr:DnaC-like helicase loader [Rhodococcus phage E3]AEQ21064.1 DnaC-like DNA replication protein [Rhodococcus phage E3]
MPSPELLRTKYIPDEDARQLYQAHPKLGSSPDKYCPTCQKTGSYYWGGVANQCDCELQLQLHKHYLYSGIGVLYQRLDWADYRGDPTVIDAIQRYLGRHGDYITRGTGMLFTGSVGIGKTLSATLLLKDLIKLGYRGYSTTFANMVEMFTAGWRSAEDKRQFQKRILRADVLLLDDLGREFRNSSKLSETTFDDVLRARTQAGRPTLITTNMDVPELLEGYGSGALSLLSENSFVHHFQGVDFRPQANQRLLDEIDAGIVRPIF